jgi:hypothetical protein
MSRALLVLANDTIRRKAALWCEKLPKDTRVEFKAPKRTLDQNSKLWAMLTEISQQLSWHGIKLSPDDWKLVMLDGLKREMRLVPNIDGTGFVNLGRSSSDLSKQEFIDLLELVAAFGAQHGVVFSDEAKAA